MVIELRGRLDPAPDKRMKGKAVIEAGLTGTKLITKIDGFSVRLVLANGNSPTAFADGPNAYAGVITAESEIASESDLDSAAAAMMTAATRVSDAIRAHQPNVGLVGQPPAFISFETRRSGEDWRGYNYWPPARPMYVQSPAETAVVLHAVENGIDLTQRLLGQAEYWALHAEGNDPEMSVLLSAIASESHAKRVLQGVLKERDEEGLGILLFGKTPPSTFSAADLYHSVSLAVAGASFKVERPNTFKHVTRLFQLRNQVAHTGRLAAEPEQARSLATASIISARRATSWLTEVCHRPLRETE